MRGGTQGFVQLTNILQECTDEEPGSSESTAERGEREEILRHFVPVNILSDRTVERMEKMEGRSRQGLVVHYCNITLTEHMRKHTGVKLYACSECSYQSIRQHKRDILTGTC